jgi:hypothetical protein
MTDPAGSAPPASPNPLGDAAATEDLVPVAARAMGAGMASAVAWAALVIWVALLTVTPSEAPQSLAAVDPDATYVNILLFGLLPTPFVAAGVAWLLMMRLPATWRRGGLVMVAVLGGSVLAMLLTFIVRELGGVHALLVLAALAVGMATWFGRGALEATRRLAAG